MSSKGRRRLRGPFVAVLCFGASGSGILVIAILVVLGRNIEGMIVEG